MQCFYTKGGPYNVFIKDRDNDFGYNIIFEYMGDNQRRKLGMDCPFFQFEIQETNCMQQVVDDNNIKRMRLIYEKFCNFESLNSNEDDYIQFSNAICREIIRLRFELNITNKKSIIKKEEKKVDPEIQDAINITNEAIKVQEEIVQKINYINKLRNNYYQKYGTFIEKTLAYLQLK